MWLERDPDRWISPIVDDPEFIAKKSVRKQAINFCPLSGHTPGPQITFALPHGGNGPTEVPAYEIPPSEIKPPEQAAPADVLGVPPPPAPAPAHAVPPPPEPKPEIAAQQAAPAVDVPPPPAPAPPMVETPAAPPPPAPASGFEQTAPPQPETSHSARPPRGSSRRAVASGSGRRGVASRREQTVGGGTSEQQRPHRIGDTLIKYKLINSVQLDEALAYQATMQERKMIGQVLIEMGYLTEIQLTTAIAKICQIPFLQIGKYNVNDEAISLVPSNVIRRLQILPLDILGNLLTIAMVNPFDYSAIREIEFHTGMKVKRIVCLQKDLEECFELFFPEEAALPMPDEDALPEIAAEEIEDDLESIFSEAEESIRTSIIEKKNLPMALSAPSSIIQTDREALVSMPSVKAIPLSKEESWEAFRMSPEYIFGHEMEAYFTSEVLKAQPIEDEVFNVISEVLH